MAADTEPIMQVYAFSASGLTAPGPWPSIFQKNGSVPPAAVSDPSSFMLALLTVVTQDRIGTGRRYAGSPAAGRGEPERNIQNRSPLSFHRSRIWSCAFGSTPSGGAGGHGEGQCAAGRLTGLAGRHSDVRVAATGLRRTGA